MDLVQNPALWSNETAAKANRIINGLLSVCLSSRTFPSIRYAMNSQWALKIASLISDRLQDERELLIRESRDSNSVLLILDRVDDPVTPLLNQWNYQAMIHELVGIKDHRVKLACDKDEIVINPEDDEFFRNNMYENYGEIGNNLNTIVEEFKTKNKS